MEERDLQIDHRVPYEVVDDSEELKVRILCCFAALQIGQNRGLASIVKTGKARKTKTFVFLAIGLTQKNTIIDRHATIRPN